MPLMHCRKCHHEWEGQKLSKCDWCGAESVVLKAQTELEAMTQSDWWKDFIANLKKQQR